LESEQGSESPTAQRLPATGLEVSLTSWALVSWASSLTCCKIRRLVIRLAAIGAYVRIPRTCAS
jgi:hypothetical protein